MTDDDPPTCTIDGCSDRSRYLLAPEGDLCREHATQRHPDTVAYLRATLGDPADSEVVR